MHFYGPCHRDVASCSFIPARWLFMVSARFAVSSPQPESAFFVVVRVRPGDLPISRHGPSRRPVGPVLLESWWPGLAEPTRSGRAATAPKRCGRVAGPLFSDPRQRPASAAVSPLVSNNRSSRAHRPPVAPTLSVFCDGSQAVCRASRQYPDSCGAPDVISAGRQYRRRLTGL